MERILRLAHALGAGLTLLAFVLSGLYLHQRFPDAYRDAPAVRFLYRANHTYLLFLGLLHLMVALYLVPEARRWRATLQALGSAALIASSLALIVAFTVEPATALPERPLTLIGALGTALGVALHLAARGIARWKQSG